MSTITLSVILIFGFDVDILFKNMLLHQVLMLKNLGYVGLEWSHLCTTKQTTETYDSGTWSNFDN